MQKKTRNKVGPIQKKLLIILGTYVALGLTRSASGRRYIWKRAIKEWQAVNARALASAVRGLERKMLIEIHDNQDGSSTMKLTDDGEKTVMRYNLDNLEIKKPKHWDGTWRFVVFDIPEKKKNAREAFRDQLNKLGFAEYQKSVFVYPYECLPELEFVVNMFEIKGHVKFLLVKDMDGSHRYRKYFKL